jgi:hypothetical protein
VNHATYSPFHHIIRSWLCQVSKKDHSGRLLPNFSKRSNLPNLANVAINGATCGIIKQ